MKNTAPRPDDPPTTLSPLARAMYQRFRVEYQITDSGGLFHLGELAIDYDIKCAALALVRAQGMTISDARGNSKAHPMLAVADAADGRMRAHARALNLDLEPLHDNVGRPPGD